MHPTAADGRGQRPRVMGSRYADRHTARASLRRSSALVYVPLRAAGRSSDLTQGFLIAVVLDIVVIPWSYVFAHYMKKPGDRWRRTTVRRAA